MASSGINRFKWFILLCIVGGSFLIWNKFESFANKEMDRKNTPTEIEKPLGKDAVKPLPTGIFSDEQVCYLLYADIDARAGEMHKRNYPEKEVKEDKSLLYSITIQKNNPYGYNYYTTGWVKFFNHHDFYFIAFDKSDDRDAFLAGFSSIGKQEKIGDCKGGIYAISNQCFACDMDFRRDMGSFIVMIARSTDYCAPQNRVPQVKKDKSQLTSASQDVDVPVEKKPWKSGIVKDKEPPKPVRGRIKQ